MRRRVIALLILAAVVGVGAVPAFAATSVNVPRKFHSLLPKIRSRSDVPVRLPSRVRTSAPHAYAAIERVRDGSYHLSLGAVRGCHESTACFIASFFAKRGAVPEIKRKVSLAHGIKGRFRPIHCGASCAAAEIQWRQRGVLYEIQYMGNKRVMVRLANSAIRAGAR